MSILSWEKFLEMVGTIPISDFQIYLDDMEISYKDKLYFLDKIDADVIVDFGCANGFILNKIREHNQNVKLIGYDLDKDMISKSRDLINDDSVVLTDNWDIVKNEISKYKKPALVLSSVIHEVYSYSHGVGVNKFWNNQVFSGNFKWICIRDMIPSVSMSRHQQELFENDVDIVKKKVDDEYLRSFENKWGIIDDNYRTFVHFLLKYRFTDNWEREVNENYLPISIETLRKKIPSGYKVSYQDNFILPYLQSQINNDFGIKLHHSTHTKMVLENINFRKTSKKFNESVDYHDIFNNVSNLEDLLVEIEDSGAKLVDILYSLQQESTHGDDLYKIGLTNNKSFDKCIPEYMVNSKHDYKVHKTYIINFRFESDVITSDEQRSGRKFSKSNSIIKIFSAFNSLKNKLLNHTVLYNVEPNYLNSATFSIMIIEGQHE